MVKVMKDAQGQLTIQIDNVSAKEAWALATTIDRGRYTTYQPDAHSFLYQILKALDEQVPVLTGEKK